MTDLERDATISEDVSDTCEDHMEPGDNKRITLNAATGSTDVDGDFTTEIYKIEVGNLPKVFSISHLKKFLVKLKLLPKKIKMVPRRNFAFITFISEEDRQFALKTLKNYEWRNKVLTAKIAKAKEDPFEKKKMEGQEELNKYKGIQDVVTPLWNVPYEEQQTIKYKDMCQVLKKVARQLKEINAGSWVEKNRSQNSGMCCSLEDLVPSAVCEGYRNKCEFTIGPGKNGSGKVVGFRISAYKDGCDAVVEPDECTHIPKAMKLAAQEFQTYIQQSSLDVFLPSTNKGFWKQLTVKTSLKEDIMCIIQISRSQEMPESELECEIEKLTKYFTDLMRIKLTSLYIEIVPVRKTAESSCVLRHALGDKFISETLCDLIFRISPQAFFQVNTKSAEILYKAIREWSNVSSNTTILDVCCGTGTIGLSMAKSARKVIGIELCSQAIEDAKFNAHSNDISNAEFCCGKAEDVIYHITETLETDDSQVVAILDPPRAGCHAKLLQAVRRCSKISKLIYVSCSPNSVIKDFVALCRPLSKRCKGTPFQIMKALPVDLFPQTRYCELLVLFERSA